MTPADGAAACGNQENRSSDLHRGVYVTSGPKLELRFQHNLLC